MYTPLEQGTKPRIRTAAWGEFLIADKNETSKIEEPISRITLFVNAGFLPPLVHFVRETVHRLGLRDEAAEHLDRVVEVVCQNVVGYAFEPGNDGRYDVLVLRWPGQVVVAVEDQGLPFDYECFKDGDPVLREMVHRSFVDEIRFVNLGRGDNKVELIKGLPHADVRDSRLEALASSRADVCVRQDHNLAFLRVAEPGDYLRELVRSWLREPIFEQRDALG